MDVLSVSCKGLPDPSTRVEIYIALGALPESPAQMT
jgi:hypothetical protein